MPQHATISNVTHAVRFIKAMQLRGLEWGDDYRAGAREAIVEILQGQMQFRLDKHLAEMEYRQEDDRRNGYYRRRLLTEIGDIELEVPRTRHFSAVGVVRAYARRVADVDRMILACFVLGLSTRKVALALLPVLGETVSATTVSRIAKTLDGAVDAFHRRHLSSAYRVAMFDGVVVSRKTGAKAVRRPVLVALGLHPDGKKEIIDFKLAASESAAEWERFLTDLYKRGLTEKDLELICVDGGAGLLAALPTVYHSVPVQRCWAHKIRNITDKVRKADRKHLKKSLHPIMNANNVVEARKKARVFADKWEPRYPKAVASLRHDLDELLSFYAFPQRDWWKAVRTTNAIERRFREVRRRTRPMGVLSDRASVERILYAVFNFENLRQGVATPVLLTHNS